MNLKAINRIAVLILISVSFLASAKAQTSLVHIFNRNISDSAILMKMIIADDSNMIKETNRLNNGYNPYNLFGLLDTTVKHENFIIDKVKLQEGIYVLNTRCSYGDECLVFVYADKVVMIRVSYNAISFSDNCASMIIEQENDFFKRYDYRYDTIENIARLNAYFDNRNNLWKYRKVCGLK